MMKRAAVLSGFIVAFSAFASDPEEVDLTSDIEIELGDIADVLTYEGSHTNTTGKLSPGARISVTHAAGNLSVNCTETDRISARLDFSVDGTQEAATKRFGDSLRLSTWGSGGSAGAKVSMGTPASSIKGYKAKMSVTMPRDVNLTIVAQRGWVEVMRCSGSVNVRAGDGGAYVKGKLTGFKVTADTGDIKVIVEPESGLAQSSSIVASDGDVRLILPVTEGAALDARGSVVDVRMPVTGQVTGTSAKGAIGSGKPPLSIRAEGAVDIRATE